MKSKVVKKNLNPKWNETIMLCVPGMGSEMSINLFDKDTMTKDDVRLASYSRYELAFTNVVLPSLLLLFFCVCRACVPHSRWVTAPSRLQRTWKEKARTCGSPSRTQRASCTCTSPIMPWITDALAPPYDTIILSRKQSRDEGREAAWRVVVPFFSVFAFTVCFTSISLASSGPLLLTGRC